MKLLSFGLVIALIGCDGDVGKTSPDANGSADASPDSDLDPCGAAASSLLGKLPTDENSCSFVVRYDYETLDPLGYQVVCAPYGDVNSGEAKNTVTKSVNYMDSATLINKALPHTHYAFYRSPGDFGGGAIVNKRNGALVFGGTIIWDGTGDIAEPITWQDYHELAPTCASSNTISDVSGVDFLKGDMLTSQKMMPLLDKISNTVVPDVMFDYGQVHKATVVLYPRSVGAFNPKTAEWIVIVTGGNKTK